MVPGLVATGTGVWWTGVVAHLHQRHRRQDGHSADGGRDGRESDHTHGEGKPRPALLDRKSPVRTGPEGGDARGSVSEAGQGSHKGPMSGVDQGGDEERGTSE